MRATRVRILKRDACLVGDDSYSDGKDCRTDHDARGVEIEEDAGNDDDLLLETGLEEVETVGDGAR